MNPECRPISLTRPTPFGDACASTCAAADRLGRDREGRLEPEALIDEHDVVVDRLRDADDRDLRPALGDLRRRSDGAAERAVAADDEEHVDAHPLQAVDDLRRVLLAARRAEDRAPVLVDVRRRTRGVRSSTSPPVLGDEPLIAVAEAVDLPHPVAGTRAPSPGARITSLRPGQSPPQVTIPARVFDGSKKIFLRGPAGSNAGQLFDRQPAPRNGRGRVVEQDPVRFVNVVKRRLTPGEQAGHRRLDAAGAEHLDLQVIGVDHGSPSGLARAFNDGAGYQPSNRKWRTHPGQDGVLTGPRSRVPRNRGDTHTCRCTPGTLILHKYRAASASFSIQSRQGWRWLDESVDRGPGAQVQ